MAQDSMSRWLNLLLNTVEFDSKQKEIIFALIVELEAQINSLRTRVEELERITSKEP